MGWRWVGSVVVRALDLWSTCCEFNSQPCTTGLVLGWVPRPSVGEYTILVCNKSPRSTHPGHPSMVKHRVVADGLWGDGLVWLIGVWYVHWLHCGTVFHRTPLLPPLSPSSAVVLSHISSHFLIPLSVSSLICTVPVQWLVIFDTIITVTFNIWPWVQMFTSADNGCPHNVLWYH